MTETRSLERTAMRSTHWLVALYAGGGEFCDGYILSIIGVALPLATPALGLGTASLGLVGAAALVGIFVGGLIFGHVTDRVGRQAVYLADIALFIVASAVQFFVSEPWQLVVLRFVMGVAIGADYAIAGTIVSEFAPQRGRGPLLAWIVAMWFAGAMVAYIVGYLLVGLGPNAWRWMLVSSVVPALLILCLRIGTPESPRWLLSRGRVDDALAAMRKMGIENPNLDELAEPEQKSSYFAMFRSGYAKRVVFVSVFWLCQVLPLFALTTYEPKILTIIGLSHGNESYLGSVVINVFGFVGALLGIVLVNRMGRRPLLGWSFGLAAVPLLVLVLVPSPAAYLALILFVVYYLVSSAGNDLQGVYPAELFPTHIRATATGFVAAMSRIGAAVGTYGAPILFAYGVRPAMLVGLGITLLGLAVTVLLAPETRHMSLAEASTTPGRTPVPPAGEGVVT